MYRPFRKVYQRLLLGIVIIVFLLLFSPLTPEAAVQVAGKELTAEIIDSVIILDSYSMSRTGDAYWLHVLVKKGAHFVPVQINLPDPKVAYRSLNLTQNTHQHCPFADPQMQRAGIVTSLERGDLIAYDSHWVSPGSSFAEANPRVVDLVVSVRGELFVVKAISVSGGCFWAYE